MDGGASADTVPELCAPPFTVEEFQSHPWGRRFTPAQAEKVVERLHRLHIEDPNSTMAVPAERMDLLVDPETQAHEELKAMAPPEEYLKRGRELIGSVGRQSLRWPGKRSFCKLVGQGLGGWDAVDVWHWVRTDDLARAAIACLYAEGPGRQVPEAIIGDVAGLLSKTTRLWHLLRALAAAMRVHADGAESEGDLAAREYHLGASWAWCASPPACQPNTRFYG